MRQNDPNRQAKFQHLHEQAVHDEQGRRRFHGAFTGGFSAGYYNTVGSEEGWAPSEWRSSREARSQDRPAQRPEDFMDDEDLAAHRGSQALVTQAGFSRAASSSSAARPAAESEAQERLGEELAGLLVVPTQGRAESMGFRILRAMGWREGFGVGERVRGRKRPRKAQGDGAAQGGAAAAARKSGRKVYGCARGPAPAAEGGGDEGDEGEGEEGGGEEDGLAARVGYAPRATQAVLATPNPTPDPSPTWSPNPKPEPVPNQAVLATPKHDLYGMGYDPHAGLSECAMSAALATRGIDHLIPGAMLARDGGGAAGGAMVSRAGGGRGGRGGGGGFGGGRGGLGAPGSNPYDDEIDCFGEG